MQCEDEVGSRILISSFQIPNRIVCMSNYILENASEFERLEKQSQNKFYDFESELRDFHPKANSVILDAGCGSGVVSRYLAHQFPHSKVIGGDFSGERVQQAARFANQIQNLEFRELNLLNADFESSSVDALVCRFVLEHLGHDQVKVALSELYRCLRPGGKACVIDIDGYVNNVFPKTPFMDDCCRKIEAVKTVNFNIGRELPFLLGQSGFVNVQWRIETMQFRHEDLRNEAILVKERFLQAMPFLISVLGEVGIARRFMDEYLETLNAPNAVLFYNKFIVLAEKQGLKISHPSLK